MTFFSRLSDYFFKKVLFKNHLFANEMHNLSKNKAVASQVVLLSFPTKNKQDALLLFPYFSSFTVLPYRLLPRSPRQVQMAPHPCGHTEKRKRFIQVLDFSPEFERRMS